MSFTLHTFIHIRVRTFRSFPTLKYFPAGSMTPEDYNGGRTLDELVAFMNGKLGTSKKVALRIRL